MKYTITVEPWPLPDSPPIHWQGDVAVDGEIVAEFTAPGGVLDHFYFALDFLSDYLDDADA